MISFGFLDRYTGDQHRRKFGVIHQMMKNSTNLGASVGFIFMKGLAFFDIGQYGPAELNVWGIYVK